MKKKFTKQDLRNTSKNVLLVIVGTIILSIGTSIFMLPFDLVTGGVSGYSIVISNAIQMLPADVVKLIPAQLITTETIITILTWAMFFIGLIVLGRSFAMKTLISTIVYPIGVAIFSNLIRENFMNGFFNLSTYDRSIGLILATVFSGVFIGLGCALSFIGGGSTGGVDVIAFIICKMFKRLRSSVVIFAVDASAILLGMFVIRDFSISLMGIVSAFIAAYVIDKVFIGGQSAFVAHIITSHPDEINRLVIEKLDRTSTIMDVTGGYSGEGKKMLMVSFTMKEYSELMNIINKTDKEAFMTINQAHEINGEGWSKYEHKKKK